MTRYAARFGIRRLLAGLALFACDNPNGPARSEQLFITATNLVLVPAETTRIGFLRFADDGVSYNHSLGVDPRLPAADHGSWSVSNSEVISVRSDGLLTALTPGLATVYIEYQGRRDSAKVAVAPDEGSTRSRFASVVLGAGHGCGLTHEREVYCWGSSWHAETGQGVSRRFTATTSPVRVSLPPSVVHLDAGNHHTCALGAAGDVYCWGAPLYAGSPMPGSSSPQKIQTTLRFGVLAVGGDHVCGLAGGGQQLTCWGSGFEGFQNLASPSLTSLSAGYDHTCGLNADGTAYCFGENRYGQLGVGDFAPRRAPTPVAGNFRFRALSGGTGFTCGVSVDLRVLCWGRGGFGALGNGSPENQPAPVVVAGLADVETVQAGGSHTCALTRDGTAYCWGNDWRGELGNGPPPTSTPTAEDLVAFTPVPVLAPTPFSAISVGWASTTCALDDSGRAFCWGNNGSGELGIGRHDLHPGTQVRLRDSPSQVRWIR